MPTTAEALQTALDHHRRGQLREAEAIYRRVLELDPRHAEGHFCLAVALHDQHDLPAAAECYREVLRLNPDHVEALCNYGNLIQSEARFDEALECYRRAILLNPEFAPAYFGRGNAYRGKGMIRDAVAAYQEAVRLEPEYVEAYNNMAVALNTLAEPDAAVEACQRGLALQPNSGQLYANLALAMQAQGRVSEAIGAHRTAVELRPNDPAEHSNLLYCLNFDPAGDPRTIFSEHLAWAQRHAEPFTEQAPPHSNDRDPDRRLRVGYLSPFFREHAVNYFAEPMISAHDHAQFEVFCYSDTQRGDTATERMKKAADHWRDVTHQSDEQIAHQVRDDGIDIFVDLTGHIGPNRLPVFARKPAPVQVTYLGYQNTTGMSAMDYRLTDAQTDPPGTTEDCYTEQLVRLPRSFFCYRPADDSPAVTPLPASTNGIFTFGSFNSLAKISETVARAWLEILSRVPGSRLFILANREGFFEHRLHGFAGQRGIAQDRIELCERRPHREYLELFSRVDIGLDPFPFNGHTTTCDSIWMGVPVVMLEGSTYASRFGGSVLRNVGLETWISNSIDAYIETAVRHADDLDSLLQLRRDLRPRMAASVLLDSTGFTRNLEQAYRRLWKTWCDSKTTLDSSAR